MPPGAKPLADEPEELAGREVERHVRLVVGVDDDEVVPVVGAPEEGPGVRIVHGQARVVLEPEVAATDATDGRVELDAVDLRIGVIDAERPRRRPGGVAEDRDPLEWASEQRRQREERVPHASGQHVLAGLPDRVHGHALVQMQHSTSVGALDDLDVLVVRGLLVEEPLLGLDRAGRKEDERCEQSRDDEVANPEQETRRTQPEARR